MMADMLGDKKPILYVIDALNIEAAQELIEHLADTHLT